MNRSCPTCSALLEEGERFCGDCGAYVEWTEEVAVEEQVSAPVAEPATVAAATFAAPPAPAPEPMPTAVQDPPKVSTTQRPEATDLAGTTGPAPIVSPSAPPDRPTGSPAPASSPDAPPAPPAPPESGVPPAPGAEWEPPPPPPAAAALVVPLSAGGAVKPGQPAPTRPGAPAPPARRPRPKIDEPLNHGDLVCGQCGAGNKPTRKFCRRCGHTLADADIAKLGWWTRLKRGLGRKPKTAGARPKSGGRRVRVPVGLLVLVAIVAAVALGGWMLRDRVEEGVDTARDRAEDLEKVTPSDLSASSSQPGHGPRLLHDGRSNRYWAPAKPGKAIGQKVTAEFGEPVRLVYVVLTPGVSAEDEELRLTQGRPTMLFATVRRADGTSEVKELDVEDRIGSQQLGIGESDVVAVQFEIRESVAGTARNSRVAIGEIEFHMRP